jgi:hypothetical protein
MIDAGVIFQGFTAVTASVDNEVKEAWTTKFDEL